MTFFIRNAFCVQFYDFSKVNIVVKGKIIILLKISYKYKKFANIYICV